MSTTQNSDMSTLAGTFSDPCSLGIFYSALFTTMSLWCASKLRTQSINTPFEYSHFSPWGLIIFVVVHAVVTGFCVGIIALLGAYYLEKPEKRTEVRVEECKDEGWTEVKRMDATLPDSQGVRSRRTKKYW